MKKFDVSKKIKLNTDFGVFRSYYCSLESQVAVVIESEKNATGDFYVRIHSSCLFSEALKSNDCDCSIQLEESLKFIIKEGGIVIYVYDEGRGAGLKNKFEAISLQQESNINTVEAFKTLGLAADLRSYYFSASILLEFYPDKQIVLLTNNPSKLNALQSYGVKVKDTKKLVFIRNDVTEKYLKEKEAYLGHKIF